MSTAWKLKSNIVSAMNDILGATNPDTGLPFISSSLTEVQITTPTEAAPAAMSGSVVLFTFADASTIEGLLTAVSAWTRSGDDISPTGNINSNHWLESTGAFTLTYGSHAPITVFPTTVFPYTTPADLQATLRAAWGIPTLVVNDDGTGTLDAFYLEFGCAADELRIGGNGTLAYGREYSTASDFELGTGMDAVRILVQADAMFGIHPALPIGNDAYINKGDHLLTPITTAYADLGAPAGGVDLPPASVTTINGKSVAEVTVDPTVTPVTVSGQPLPNGSVLRNTTTGQKFLKTAGSVTNYFPIPVAPETEWNWETSASIDWAILQAK